jgi:hypothetical protein
MKRPIRSAATSLLASRNTLSPNQNRAGKIRRELMLVQFMASKIRHCPMRRQPSVSKIMSRLDGCPRLWRPQLHEPIGTSADKHPRNTFHAWLTTLFKGASSELSQIVELT